MKIALLTGASSGLGRMFAEKIHIVFPEIEEIWCVARRLDRLEEIKREVTDVKIVPVCADITNEDERQAIFDRVKREKAEISLLINNAGCGFHGALDSSDIEEQERCIRLNVLAMTLLTRSALDYMPKGARILTTSSIASFVPNANMAVYSASKAYATFFSRALNEELSSSRRSATAVCPAPMNTEFLTVGHVKGNSKTFERLPYCDVEKVALGALKAAKLRKAVYTPRAFYKFYRFITRFLPDGLLIKMAKT
ncbi:MAG: SDR family NAD(P)-dependent oxidoreductase [Clostridia bacterium]|nr:SDR family NAD(P)-dependent oxidoreductase [Clostridia bacterium]MBQ4159140.1 SDR family NAD(P)-dependent oxidoreductase [Clostridia bacterium]MBQ9856645.1 SDR family NAD(P)-dependent oxidoreductase [Clostridia bacterium]